MENGRCGCGQCTWLNAIQRGYRLARDISPDGTQKFFVATPHGIPLRQFDSETDAALNAVAILQSAPRN